MGCNTCNGPPSYQAPPPQVLGRGYNGQDCVCCCCCQQPYADPRALTYDPSLYEPSPENTCDRAPITINPYHLTPLPPGIREQRCHAEPYQVPGGANCPPWVRWGGPVGFNPGWGGSLWPAH
eukprot:TRINITY_DN38850_c0_g1_i1.p1 TRINITY_DN38850_c0_g1~~TRINITY_DN38850_c0_g1_i1.p1  ORF type:complete len:134 (+),score=3.85 TRINITY_DN38850_c0_g1_i1:38-403(+)